MYAPEILLASFAALAMALPQGYNQKSYADTAVDIPEQRYDTSRSQQQQQWQPQQQQNQQWQPQQQQNQQWPQQQQNQQWGQQQAQNYGQQQQQSQNWGQQQQQSQNWGQQQSQNWGQQGSTSHPQQADHTQQESNKFQQSSSSSSSPSQQQKQQQQIPLNFDTTPSSQSHAYQQQNASLNQLTQLDSSTQASQVIVVKDVQAEIELDIDQLVCQVFSDAEGNKQVGNDFSAKEPCELGEETVPIQSVKCWIN